MSLGCFVEKRRFLQLPPRKTSLWLAQFFEVDLSDNDGRFGTPFFDMSNIQQYNNSRKEGTAEGGGGTVELRENGRRSGVVPLSHRIM
jgi:hypothetical protein